jgi:hypothetical protein
VKGVALNLTHSPETFECWERADPFLLGAGQAVSATETSTEPTPRGRRQHRATQRQASNQASDETQSPWGGYPRKPPSILFNVKRGQEKAASRVMGTGEPQGRSEEAANPRRAKVPTVGRP